MAMPSPSLNDLKLLVFILALAISFSSKAGAQFVTPTCPTQIDVQQGARQPPSGFDTFNVGDSYPLINIQFSDGSPDQKAWLAPTSTTKAKNGTYSVWAFELPNDGIWMSCVYNRTSVVASVRLPAAVTSCRVNYDTHFTPPAATTVECKTEEPSASQRSKHTR
jgi:hypothetical protein